LVDVRNGCLALTFTFRKAYLQKCDRSFHRPAWPLPDRGSQWSVLQRLGAGPFIMSTAAVSNWSNRSGDRPHRRVEYIKTTLNFSKWATDS